MQIELAKERALPVIVHSRDAFEETLPSSGIQGTTGRHPCFATQERGEAFLDRGWYISFRGT
jgi:TatD DNase family protein